MPAPAPAPDLWSLGFLRLLRERAPSGISLELDAGLTVDPPRADTLLLRRDDAHLRAGEAGGRVLRRLWPLLGATALVQYHRPSAAAYRWGDLIRLWRQGIRYQAMHDLTERAALSLVLVVASAPAALRDEILRMSWKLVPLGDGYTRIDNAVYPTYLVETDQVADAEQDDLLRIFSHHPLSTPEACRWLIGWLSSRPSTL